MDVIFVYGMCNFSCRIIDFIDSLYDSCISIHNNKGNEKCINNVMKIPFQNK